VQTQLSAEFRAGDAAMAEFGKHTKLNRSEENLGRPERKGRL
jgi:hypothetical protein